MPSKYVKKKPHERKIRGKNGRGVKHEPTDAMRQKVSSMAAIGIPHKDIARVIDIDDDTLRQYYRDELDKAHIMANSQVGGHLFKKALSGDTACLIFWAKTRMGWKESMLLENNPESPLKLQVTIVDDVK
jgi:hypothetical protein